MKPDDILEDLQQFEGKAQEQSKSAPICPDSSDAKAQGRDPSNASEGSLFSECTSIDSGDFIVFGTTWVTHTKFHFCYFCELTGIVTALLVCHLDDTVDSDCQTKKTKNRGRQVDLVKHLRALSIDTDDVSENFPLVCDDSPMFSSDHQIHSPSFRNIWSGDGAFQRSQGRDAAPFVARDDPISTSRAIHRRTIVFDSPGNSASQGKRFSAMSPPRGKPMNSNPLAEASLSSRNVLGQNAGFASPVNAVHSRKGLESDLQTFQGKSG